MARCNTILITLAITASLLASAVNALGINCRGSGLCPRASWDNLSPSGVAQILYDAIKQSTLPDSTEFGDKQHVVCVSQSQPLTLSGGADGDGLSGTFTFSGNIAEGGICVFPQLPTSGDTLSLGQIRALAGALLEHGCSVCGSVPIHYVDHNSNDPSAGILTFNYVASPFCTGNCISNSGTSSDVGTTGAPPESTFTSSTSTTSSMSSATPTTSTSSTTPTSNTSSATPTSSAATVTVIASSTSLARTSVTVKSGPSSFTFTTAPASTASGTNSTFDASSGSTGSSPAAAASNTSSGAKDALKVQGVGAAGAALAVLAML